MASAQSEKIQGPKPPLPVSECLFGFWVGSTRPLAAARPRALRKKKSQDSVLAPAIHLARCLL